MMLRRTMLERAFEMAGSGRCANLTELKQQLRRDGFDPIMLEGPLLIRQLKRLIAASKADPPALIATGRHVRQGDALFPRPRAAYQSGNVKHPGQ